jgi:hypothetical protein
MKTQLLIQQTSEHLESACKLSNYAAKLGETKAVREWNETAQALRAVLVQYGALSKDAL